MISAKFSSVKTEVNFTIPWVWSSRLSWNRISMCFVLALETPNQMFFSMPLLLQDIGGKTSSPVMSLCSWIRPWALHVALEQATYSTSVVDITTRSCFFNCQLIGPPYTWKRKPPWDFVSANLLRNPNPYSWVDCLILLLISIFWEKLVQHLSCALDSEELFSPPLDMPCTILHYTGRVL